MPSGPFGGPRPAARCNIALNIGFSKNLESTGIPFGETAAIVKSNLRSLNINIGSGGTEGGSSADTMIVDLNSDRVESSLMEEMKSNVSDQIDAEVTSVTIIAK